MDFGELVAGETARRKITLENIGGGTAEGSVQAPEGWSVEGAADYKLRGGMKQAFTLVFAPAEQRAYDGEIEYTGNPERATDIKGSEVPPGRNRRGKSDVAAGWPGALWIGPAAKPHRPRADIANNGKPEARRARYLAGAGEWHRRDLLEDAAG